MPPAGVHFNGSVNLPDTETVMREISSRIPRGVRRVTDGETGERYYWIMFQVQKFAAMPDFQSAGMREPLPGVELPPMPLLRLADGVAAEDVHWPDLGTPPLTPTPTRSSAACKTTGRSHLGCAFRCST